MTVGPARSYGPGEAGSGATTEGGDRVDVVGPSGRGARWAAVSVLLPALGFGLPTPFVLSYLQRYGHLPMTPFGFRSHAGGPFEQLPTDAFVAVGWVFVATCALDVAASVLLWRGERRGGVLAAALTPVQLVFAIGFAFPFLLLALPIRAVLLSLARPTLR